MIRRATLGGSLAVAAALVLSACAPPAAEPTAWQQNVQTVAEQASAGDYASALSTLDALEAEVVARRDAGEISAEEADGILTRIATVRADLAGLVPTPTPTPEPAQSTEPAQTEPAQTEPTQTEPAPDDQQNVVDDGEDDTSGGGAGGGPSDKKPDDEKGPGNGKGPGKKDG